MLVDMNEELHKLSIYSDRVCEKCGRKYPETVLNLEGAIHHNSKPHCIDTKSCERIKRKRKK